MNARNVSNLNGYWLANIVWTLFIWISSQNWSTFWMCLSSFHLHFKSELLWSDSFDSGYVMSAVCWGTPYWTRTHALAHDSDDHWIVPWLAPSWTECQASVWQAAVSIATMCSSSWLGLKVHYIAASKYWLVTKLAVYQSHVTWICFLYAS